MSTIFMEHIDKEMMNKLNKPIRSVQLSNDLKNDGLEVIGSKESGRLMVKITKPSKDYFYYESIFKEKYPKDILFLKNNDNNDYKVYTNDELYYKKVLNLNNGEKVNLSDSKIEEYKLDLDYHDDRGNKLSNEEYKTLGRLRILKFTVIFMYMVIVVLMVYLSIYIHRYIGKNHLIRKNLRDK